MPSEQKECVEALRTALDRVSELGDESPPTVETLQLLAVEIMREQRQETLRQLAFFWLVAAGLLAGGIYAMSRSSLALLLWQGSAALGMLAGAWFWLGSRKRVTE